MHGFRHVAGRLHCERVLVEALARRHGTPLYVYSEQTMADHFVRLKAALGSLDPLICYAMKANSNLAVLRVFAGLGAGFDLVSGGELERALAAGADPGRCVFAGVGKTEDEIRLALAQGVYALNVESEPELVRIDRLASRMGRRAPVAIRVNPGVDARTHAKITTGTYENKFGIAFEQVAGMYRRASRLRGVWLRGVQMHIGSQLTEAGPFERAVRKVAPLAAELASRHGIEFFSIGGGAGIVYRPALASGEPRWWRSGAARGVLTPERYAAAVVPWLRPLGLRILLEPGRLLVGNAGILVTRVEYVKRTGRKTFVIVDAGMNDLIRPAFYDAYHEIVPLRRRGGGAVVSDVVGPICESGDWFCKGRPLPRVQAGEYLAICSAGAYGSVMGSNYNTRPQAAEVLVRGVRAALVRRRQALAEIWAGEQLAPWQGARAARRQP
ncbi:MAG TPA: diaminopimelate decarboxylase [Verrucomicrobiota bacterium]|nr:diaminopimelate decarboxylase [Verrucomicrobiota bacterium]HNU51941.1 diaminopimelate decarboxylase [Verrucomicrobiota bacterium]